ncbi:DUF1559 domain-containing protein [Tautonia plasticadhaerens]|uniref:Type II secretion system protein G n=1 Tax=Tautonia plasticadhaerens TaxID=2527974 RepID=A0A518H5M7_9BACT|nr:DUF1559 domain-containing protein [Tautonia plasticadhaerens]QDV36139.1 Type II secretion system protein G precursor [Tautonia plasticadhaerens]
MTRTTRRGFTLIELLVVIAIIGVLIALLLPAVQAAREAARRAQCTNNLKQIGLALHNYHQAVGSFPMAITTAYSDLGVQTNWGTWGSLSLLLPYLEQKPLYDAINFDWNCWQGRGNLENQTPYLTRVNAFVCPSDGLTGQDNTNNYFGSVGTTATVTSNAESTGIFARSRTYGIHSVRDGTSNTVAFSEALVSTTPGSPRQEKWRDAPAPSGASPGAAYYLLDATQQRAALLQDWEACNGYFMSTTEINRGQRGYRWGLSNLGESLFQTLVPPNSNQYPWNSCRLDCGGCGALHSGYYSATSNHPGGVNVALTDGSVRFLKSTIAMEVWWALGTRAKGEVVSADQY